MAESLRMLETDEAAAQAELKRVLNERSTKGPT